MKAYTDYPFEFLGDIKGELASVREINVLWWDGNKYATSLCFIVDAELIINR